ncbi:MAG TPA: hypothetical protein EYP35_09790, partial [Desulfobacterales bacterium]|nr:hypothetical protein [Desulfobacterales bacterium]
QMFPQTANTEYLELWAEYEGITRFPATGSSGDIIFTGNPASVIPIGTKIKSVSDSLYETSSTVTIATNTVSIMSLTLSGDTVSAVTSSPHGLASGMQTTISGAVETEYNGTYQIIVAGEDQFTYTITTAAPSSPATGAITASSDYATARISSVSTGKNTNLDSGAQLKLAVPVSGIDTIAFVPFVSISGGSDAETDDLLLTRVMQSRVNPVTNFNVIAVEKAALGIPGVTRVKVKRITPRIGAVTILFMRDNDDGGGIPSAAEVLDVEAAIIEMLPATSDIVDVVVKAPVPVATDYTFTSLTPDTATMRYAISQNLSAFYEDAVEMEASISADKYRAAIIDTIDPETGDTLQFFTLASPVGDIVIAPDKIGVLGNITYP